MREYGKVQLRFWANSGVQQLSDREKLLALYMLTGPHSNSLGCFRLPPSYVSADLCWSLAAASKAIRALEKIDFAYFDNDTSWLFLPRHLHWNKIENPNQGKNLASLFDLVPPGVWFYSELMKAILEQPKYLPEGFCERLQKGFGEPFRNQEPDKERLPEPLPKPQPEHEPLPEPDKDVCVRFEKFWSAYPRKEARQNAWEAFQKLNPDDEQISRILPWLQEACKSEQWQDKNKIPHAAKWLAEKRWDGDPPPKAKPPKSVARDFFGGEPFDPDGIDKKE
jgi:hypothetical protein